MRNRFINTESPMFVSNTNVWKICWNLIELFPWMPLRPSFFFERAFGLSKYRRIKKIPDTNIIEIRRKS